MSRDGRSTKHLLWISGEKRTSCLAGGAGKVADAPSWKGHVGGEEIGDYSRERQNRFCLRGWFFFLIKKRKMLLH